MADNHRSRRMRWLQGLAAALVCLALLGVHPLLAGGGAVASVLFLGRRTLLGGRTQPASDTAPRGGPSDPSESETRFRALLESLPKVAVQGYDCQRRVVYWNAASTQLYGYTTKEAIGSRLEDLLIPEEMRDSVIAAHHAWVAQGVGIPPGELTLRHRSGTPVEVFSYHVMLGERTDNPLMFCIDVDRRAVPDTRREFDLVSGFDGLTHLPDWSTFEVALSDGLAGCRRRGDRLAVVCLAIDWLDGFRAQRFERPRCDTLMAMLAHRVNRDCRPFSMTRTQAGKLVLALTGLHSEEDVLAWLDGVFATIGQPFMLDGHELQASASVGISLYPHNGASAAELVHTADMAMQRAALAGPNSYWFFDRRLHEELTRQQRLMERLRDGLREGEFVLRYAPRTTADGERIEGLDVRLQWASGEGGTACPLDFLPDDERADLVQRLGDWVLQEACRQHSPWLFTADGCRMDINLPAVQGGGQPTPLDTLEAYMTSARRPGAAPGDVAQRGKACAIRIEALPVAAQRDHA